MTTALSTLDVRLGASAAAVARAWGPPQRVEHHGVGIARWYVRTGLALVVLFAKNRAIALHCPYQHPCLQRSDRAALMRRWVRRTAGQIYLADTGVIVTTADCPRRAVDLTATLAGDADAARWLAMRVC